MLSKVASNAAAVAVSTAWRGGAIPASFTAPTFDGFVNICGKVAPLASLVLFLAPIPTVNKILKKRSVGDLPLLPYASMATNAFLWSVYGLLISELKVWSTNMMGFVLALYYFVQFTRFSPKASPTLPGSVKQQFLTATSIMACAVLTVLSPLSRSKSAKIVGSSAVAICLAMFASPLAALRTVFKNQSAESIALPLSVATAVNCFLWTVVGIFDMHDFNIIFPNSLGMLFGLFQLTLIAIFKDGPSKDKEDAIPAASSM